MADLPWFRFYNETINDVKFKRISRTMQADQLTIIGAWAVLLSLASKSPQRGKLYMTDTEPYTPEDIADVLNWQQQDTDALIDCFMQMGMVAIIDGAFIILNWDKRQYESDSARNRMRKHRELLRNSDVTVTPPDTDTDTDSDKRYDDNSGEVEKTPLPKQSNIFTLYEQNIGIITPLIAEKLKAAEQDYSPDWIVDAFQAAVNANARSWAYVFKVLENRRLGKDTRRNGNGSKPAELTPDENAKMIVEELTKNGRLQQQYHNREEY